MNKFIPCQEALCMPFLICVALYTSAKLADSSKDVYGNIARRNKPPLRDIWQFMCRIATEFGRAGILGRYLDRPTGEVAEGWAIAKCL